MSSSWSIRYESGLMSALSHRLGVRKTGAPGMIVGDSGWLTGARFGACAGFVRWLRGSLRGLGDAHGFGP